MREMLLVMGVVVACLAITAGGVAADPGQHEVNVTDGAGTVHATYHYDGTAVNVEYANGTTESIGLSNENESALAIDWAVANTTAGYDTVVVGPGTYNGSVDVETSDRTIEGMGPSATQLTGLAGSQTGIRIAGTGTNVSSLRIEEYGGGLSVGETGIDIVAADASVTDIEIDSAGDGIDIDASSTVVDNVTLTANRGSGVSIISGATNATITNSVLRSNDVYGLRSRAVGTVLRNSTVEDNNYGIRIDSSANYSRLRNNSILSNFNEGITVAGSHAIVHENSIDDHLLTGIRTTQQSVNLSISDNEITDTAGSGPGSSSTGLLIRGDGHDIRDTVVLNSEDYGIDIDGADNLTLVNDSVSASGIHGIRLAPSNGTSLHNVSSTDNGGTGLVLSDSDAVEVHGGTLSSNADNGTTVSNTDDFVLAESTVQDNGDHGVRFVSNVDSSLIRDSDIYNHSIEIVFGTGSTPLFGSDNRVVNNSVDGGVGIQLRLAYNTTIVDNHLAGSGHNGIWSNSDRSTIRNNTIANYQTGIYISFGADNSTIRNNAVSGTSTGISVSGPNNATVSHNEIEANFQALSLFSSSNIRMRSNNVTDADVGIDLQDTTNITITEMTALDNRFQTFNVRGDTSNVTIRGVSIEGSGNYGIRLREQTSNVSVFDSSISDRTTNVLLNGTGHVMRNVSVRDSDTGVLVGGSNVSIQEATVTDNTDGLTVANATDVDVSGGTWSGGETAMHVRKSTGTTIRSAVVEGANRSGIRVKSSENVTVQDATVRDNAVGGSYLQLDGGVVVNNSVDVDLEGSSLLNNSRYGVFVTQANQNVVIRDTRIIDSPNLGVDTNGPTTFRNVTVARSGMTGIDLEAGATLEDVIAQENEDTGISIEANATLRNVVSVNNSAEDLSFGTGVTNGSNATAGSIPFASVNGTHWTINDTAGTVPGAPNGTEVVGEPFGVTGLTVADAFGDTVIDYGEIGAGGLDESTLSLYHLNESAGSWEAVSGGSVDASADTYSFTFTPGDNGTYRLHAEPGGSGGTPIPPPPSGGGGGGTMGSPAFTIAERTLDATEIDVGEPVTVSVRVENNGEASGTYTVDLAHAGEVLDSESVQVNQNGEDTLELETIFDETGSYELVAGGESAGTVTVLGQPSLSITDVSLDRTAVDRGSTVSITASVENTGSGEGEMTVPLTVGGEEVATETVSTAPGEATTVTFNHTVTEDGSLSVNVGGQDAGTVEVAESSATGGLPLVLGAIVGALLVGGSLGAYYFRNEIGDALDDFQS